MPVIQTPMADLAGIYLKGVQTRAQIQEDNQRLAQQQQEIAMRAQQESQARQIQAQQFQQEHAVAQQRIQVEKAYQQQQIDLKKQDLAEAQKMNEQKTQAAAKQFEARQMWERNVGAIQDDPSISQEEKANRMAQLAIRSGMSGQLPAETTSAVLNWAGKQKPTIPPGVTKMDGYTQLIDSEGHAHIYPDKPVEGEKEPKVPVMLPGIATPVTVPLSLGQDTIRHMKPEDQANSLNKAVMEIPPWSPGNKTQPTKKISKRVRQNGVVYEYDGKSWNPVGE